MKTLLGKFELHTLGLNGGYVSNDIRQLAMAISGWSGFNQSDSGPQVSNFVLEAEPGNRNVLGKSYPASEQGESILRDLAQHKKTARFISYKMAQHFIADEPPKELVVAMTDIWLKTRGNIKAVVTSLVEHPQSWNLESKKVKTPREFVVSACRAIDQPKAIDEEIVSFALRGLNTLGQTPFAAGSPAGYAQLNMDWMGSDALMKRIDWVNQLSHKTRQTPKAAAERIYASKLSPLTAKLISEPKAGPRDCRYY